MADGFRAASKGVTLGGVSLMPLIEEGRGWFSSSMTTGARSNGDLIGLRDRATGAG